MLKVQLMKCMKMRVNMKLNNKLIFFLISLFLLSFNSCNDNKINFNKKFNNNKLINSIYNKIIQQNDSIIVLKDFTDFKWDYVYIFTPYTSDKKISSVLGFKWKYSDEFKINEEEFCLIIFTYKTKIINILLYPRIKGDFVNLNKNKFSKVNSKFLYSQNKYDNRFYDFREIN